MSWFPKKTTPSDDGSRALTEEASRLQGGFQNIGRCISTILSKYPILKLVWSVSGPHETPWIPTALQLRSYMHTYIIDFSWKCSPRFQTNLICVIEKRYGDFTAVNLYFSNKSFDRAVLPRKRREMAQTTSTDCRLVGIRRRVTTPNYPTNRRLVGHMTWAK